VKLFSYRYVYTVVLMMRYDTLDVDYRLTTEFRLSATMMYPYVAQVDDRNVDVIQMVIRAFILHQIAISVWAGPDITGRRTTQEQSLAPLPKPRSPPTIITFLLRSSRRWKKSIASSRQRLPKSYLQTTCLSILCISAWSAIVTPGLITWYSYSCTVWYRCTIIRL
jgi:hypothetical protein